jgi:hypothetical protein
MSSTSIKKTLAPENKKRAVWLAPLFRLVSLLDMLKFHASAFYSLASLLQVKAYPPQPIRNEVIPNVEKEVASLGRVKEHCQIIGLDFSAMYVDKIIEVVKEGACTYGKLMGLVEVLQGRISDESSLHLFMQIPKSKAEYFESPTLFGQDVANSFSEATYDISEAGNCYAMGRNTACVMHLMRALEVALKAIGIGIGIPDPVTEARNSWGTMLNTFRDRIRANNRAGNADWTASSGFYENARSYLDSVRVAWRNPSMHLEAKYDEQEALRIYNAVKGFMEHIATHLDESGNFTP